MNCRNVDFESLKKANKQKKTNTRIRYRQQNMYFKKNGEFTMTMWE